LIIVLSSSSSSSFCFSSIKFFNVFTIYIIIFLFSSFCLRRFLILFIYKLALLGEMGKKLKFIIRSVKYFEFNFQFPLIFLFNIMLANKSRYFNIKTNKNIGPNFSKYIQTYIDEVSEK